MKAVSSSKYPTLKMKKQMLSNTDDGNTTADTNSQSHISPPQQKGRIMSNGETPEASNQACSSNFEELCSNGSALKSTSHVIAGSPISESDAEHENHESKSDDGNAMTLNQMIDAKCDDKLNSASSSRRGSISMTTAS